MEIPVERIKEYNAKRQPEDRASLCHAPSVNLNFEQNGFATACCYNRRFILGQYPKNSIEQIWNGPRVKELRELVKKNDLSHGCQICSQQFAAGNFSGLRARWFDQKRTSPLMPRTMEFEISNVCNLECVMCNGYFSSSIRRNREKLEPMKNPYDDNFVEQLRPFIPHLLDMKFLGGEPFLNPLYYKIWDLILELNPKINTAITTNGTILNKKNKELILNLNPNIIVSVDSLDKKTYEFIRKNANYESMIENVNFFLKVAKINGRHLIFTVCPMQQNWRTLPEILNFCNKNSIFLSFNTVTWPPECSLKYLPRTQLQGVYKFLKSALQTNLNPADPWPYQDNYKSYGDMLNQINLWLNEMIQ